MEKDRLFNEILTYKDEFDADDLGMIISNDMDCIIDSAGAISIKSWSELIIDILRWHNMKNKSNKTMQPIIKEYNNELLE